MQKITKGRRLTGSIATAFGQEAKREYDAGKTVRTIAAESGRSYGAVHRALRRAGARFRARGGNRRQSPARDLLGRRGEQQPAPRRGSGRPETTRAREEDFGHHDVVILAVLHDLAPDETAPDRGPEVASANL